MQLMVRAILLLMLIIGPAQWMVVINSEPTIAAAIASCATAIFLIMGGCVLMTVTQRPNSKVSEVAGRKEI